MAKVDAIVGATNYSFYYNRCSELCTFTWRTSSYPCPCLQMLVNHYLNRNSLKWIPMKPQCLECQCSGNYVMRKQYMSRLNVVQTSPLISQIVFQVSSMVHYVGSRKMFIIQLLKSYTTSRISYKWDPLILDGSMGYIGIVDKPAEIK